MNLEVTETDDMCDFYLQDMTCYIYTADNAGGGTAAPWQPLQFTLSSMRYFCVLTYQVTG